jgi:glycosyltransferase involved in cell wall biosynthesis
MVSVLMPAYNAERYIAQAIESVLRQTFRDFELIVIDDGSSDRTQAIAEEYAATDSRVRVISHANIGMGESLNRAMAQARFEWIARLDADDLMLPHRLERQLAFVLDNPDVAVAASFVRFIAEDGRTLGTGRYPYTSRSIVQQYLRDNLVISLSHPSVLIRRSVAQEVGGYRAQYWPCDDLDLWCRIAERGGTILVQPEILTEYRRHADSACSTSARQIEERRAWVQASMRCRRGGLPEPTWEEYLSERRQRPWHQRLASERYVATLTLYSAAVSHLSGRKYRRLLLKLMAALVLNPSYIASRVVRRIGAWYHFSFRASQRLVNRLPDREGDRLRGTGTDATSGAASTVDVAFPQRSDDHIPMISVVMPAYNAESFVGEAIDSVLAQTFRDFELIVIDDGSSDRTLDILRDRAARDPRVRVFTQSNRGIAATLNRGVELARSEWIARIDADDRMLPHRLERQLAFLGEHPDLSVAGSLIRYISEDGHPLGTRWSPFTTPEAVSRAVRSNRVIAVPHNAVLMRRSAVQAVGYRPEYVPVEDLDLWNRMVERGHRILVQPEVLTEYRIHPHSAGISATRLTNVSVSWVKRALLCRRSGLPEPTREEFMAEMRQKPWPARLKWERQLLARALYTAAVRDLSVRQYSRLVPKLIAALSLDPRYVTPRIWRRLIV